MKSGRADVRKLHVFGSVAYAHVPDSQRRKLDKKSRKMLFVDYEKMSDNYRLYDVMTKKVFVSAHVNFTKDGEEDDKYLFTLVHMEEKTEAESNENSNEQGSSLDDNGSNSESENESSASESQSVEYRRKLRSPSEIKKPTRFEANFAVGSEPQTYMQAMKSNESQQWKTAVEKEVEAHIKNKTWQEAELPKGRKTIDCKWIFKVKKTPGEPDRFKARLVARGFWQKEGIDYGEIYAPVVRYESIRTLLTLAASEDLHIQQFDVKTAIPS